MTTIGIDIGGANLKLATSNGHAVHRPFALWRHPHKLASEIDSLLRPHPAEAPIAVVMTGELADCFASRREGVTAIAKAVAGAGGTRTLRFFGLDGSLHPFSDVVRCPLDFAAANWLALATWTARLHPDASLLVDVGTTTTDLVPLQDGHPIPRARDDLHRLAAGELVYCGVVRTPLAGLAQHLPYRGDLLPVVPEYFATTLDAYLVRRQLAEHEWDTHTADGKPSDVASSIRRMGRVVLATEPEEFSAADAEAMSDTIHRELVGRLAAAVARCEPSETNETIHVVVSGTGEFAAREAIREVLGSAARVTSLAESFSAQVSMCAPAYALAWLAETERIE